MESIELIDFDDGHSPGATKIKTKLALYKGKHRSNFFAMFDGLLPEDWCTRAYNYALERKRPWGKLAFVSYALCVSLIFRTVTVTIFIVAWPFRSVHYDRRCTQFRNLGGRYMG